MTEGVTEHPNVIVTNDKVMFDNTDINQMLIEHNECLQKTNPTQSETMAKIIG